MIFDGENWLHNSAEISQYFLDNFNEVFSMNIPEIPKELGDLGFDPISTKEKNNMMKIPLEEEIKECIQALHPLKAPGPDNFPEIFFRHYWNTIRLQVIKSVQECCRIGKVIK